MRRVVTSVFFVCALLAGSASVYAGEVQPRERDASRIAKIVRHIVKFFVSTNGDFLSPPNP